MVCTGLDNPCPASVIAATNLVCTETCGQGAELDASDSILCTGSSACAIDFIGIPTKLNAPIVKCEGNTACASAIITSTELVNCDENTCNGATIFSAMVECNGQNACEDANVTAVCIDCIPSFSGPACPGCDYNGAIDTCETAQDSCVPSSSPSFRPSESSSPSLQPAENPGNTPHLFPSLKREDASALKLASNIEI